MGQLNLSTILKELHKSISYKKPNFENEWNEAIRYPEFKKMGKNNWIELAKSGKTVKYSTIKDNLSNVDLDFAKLDKNKKSRFETAYKEGIIEMPIAVKFSDSDYDLVAGNTRLSGLVKSGIDPKIWVIELKE
jgi:hypothetical protein